VWGSFYVFMVPFVGIIFWLLPGRNFYDANLTREAGFRSDLSSLAGMLAPAIQDQEAYYTARHRPGPEWTIKGARFVVQLTSVWVVSHSIRTDDAGNVSLTVDGYAQNLPGRHDSSKVILFSVLVNLSVGYEIDVQLPDGTGALGYTVSFIKELDYNSPQTPMSVIFPNLSLPLPPGQVSPNVNQSVLYLPFATASIVDRLAAASNGDPREASGLLTRMIYFSAVTITTLGFGDITPVSSVARLLVGIEAVVGAVLVGLFLNAVAQKWGNEPGRRQHSGQSESCQDPAGHD
jgi:Ion channel